MVTEGEKAADAAARLCGSDKPNGAKSADKADWSPLRGRPHTAEAGRHNPEGDRWSGIGMRRADLPPVEISLILRQEGRRDAVRCVRGDIVGLERTDLAACHLESRAIVLNAGIGDDGGRLRNACCGYPSTHIM